MAFFLALFTGRDSFPLPGSTVPPPTLFCWPKKNVAFYVALFEEISSTSFAPSGLIRSQSEALVLAGPHMELSFFAGLRSHTVEWSTQRPHS